MFHNLQGMCKIAFSFLTIVCLDRFNFLVTYFLIYFVILEACSQCYFTRWKFLCFFLEVSSLATLSETTTFAHGLSTAVFESLDFIRAKESCQIASWKINWVQIIFYITFKNVTSSFNNFFLLDINFDKFNYYIRIYLFLYLLCLQNLKMMRNS